MMDKWTRMQDLVEDVFGKRPESPEMLLEYMILMADMLIDSNDIGSSNQPSRPAQLTYH